MTKHDIESMAANGQLDRAAVGPALAHLARLEELGSDKKRMERQIKDVEIGLEHLLNNAVS